MGLPESISPRQWQTGEDGHSRGLWAAICRLRGRVPVFRLFLYIGLSL